MLPYGVYSYFQNGGRFCWVIRSAPVATASSGTAAKIAVNGAIVTGTLTSFYVEARSVGQWGNDLQYGLVTQDTVTVGSKTEDVFDIQVLLKNSNGDYEVRREPVHPDLRPQRRPVAAQGGRSHGTHGRRRPRHPHGLGPAGLGQQARQGRGTDQPQHRRVLQRRHEDRDVGRGHGLDRHVDARGRLR
jgi:hypothetical protein